ncbi:MAG: ribonuclease domain-containing protein, partial [Acutalibacteraceae bacterium]
MSKDLSEFFTPKTHDSSEYKNWISPLSLTTCGFCRWQHGKIYRIYEDLEIEPPVHDRCDCEVIPMKAVYFGDATQDGQNGADVYLSIYGRLPLCYITKEEAKNAGWINVLGNLNAIAPGKVIGCDVYGNRNGHLPSALGRIWYEADINYDTGYRNHHRLIYSNDGLIFA